MTLDLPHTGDKDSRLLLTTRSLWSLSACYLREPKNKTLFLPAANLLLLWYHRCVKGRSMMKEASLRIMSFHQEVIVIDIQNRNKNWTLEADSPRISSTISFAATQQLLLITKFCVPTNINLTFLILKYVKGRRWLTV